MNPPEPVLVHDWLAKADEDMQDGDLPRQAALRPRI